MLTLLLHMVDAAMGNILGSPKSVCRCYDDNKLFPIKQETNLTFTKMQIQPQQEPFQSPQQQYRHNKKRQWQAQQRRRRSLRRDKVDVYARLVQAVSNLQDHEYEGGALLSRVERRIQCNTKHFRNYLQSLLSWGLIRIDFLQKKMVRRRMRSYRVIRVTDRGMRFLELHDKLTELWQIDEEQYEVLRVKQKTSTAKNSALLFVSV